MKKTTLSMVMATGMLLVSTAVWANFEDLGSSARPMGMGNAFTALATDVNALYYNPAGLAFLQAAEGTSSYTRYLLGLDDSALGGGYLALALPLGEMGGIGIGYTNFQLSGYYQEHVVTLGYGYRAMSNLAIGLNLKGLMSNIGQDAYTAIDPLFQTKGYSTSGVAVDLSILYQFLPQYRLALAVTNVNQPNMALSGEDRVPMMVKVGFAYRSFGLDVATDVAYQSNTGDIDFYVGAEKWLADRSFALRAGLAFGSREDKDASLGASYRTDALQMDYAFLYPLAGLTKTYGTHRMALSVRFGPPSVEDEETFGVVPMISKALYDEELEKVRASAKATQGQVEVLQAQLKVQQERVMTVAPSSNGDLDKVKADLEANSQKLATFMKMYADQQAKLNTLEEQARRKIVKIVEPVANGDNVAKPEPTKPMVKPEPTTPSSVVPASYTVQSGDTLRSLAKKFYGSEDKWVDIYKMNEDRIKQGILTQDQVLILPKVKP